MSTIGDAATCTSARLCGGSKHNHPPSETAQAIEVVTGVPRSPGETSQIMDQRHHRLDGGVTLEFRDIRPHHRESGYPGIVHRRERVARFVV